MIIRIGKVTNVYAATGKVKVLYEDTGNTSVKLPMLTFNNEYCMPAIGAHVLTAHMENGSSKGFVLGTYWSDSNVPPEVGNIYYKDMGNGTYVKSSGGTYSVRASAIKLIASAGTITAEMLVAALEKISKLEEKVSSLEGQIESLAGGS